TGCRCTPTPTGAAPISTPAGPVALPARPPDARPTDSFGVPRERPSIGDPGASARTTCTRAAPTTNCAASVRSVDHHRGRNHSCYASSTNVLQCEHRNLPLSCLTKRQRVSAMIGTVEHVPHVDARHCLCAARLMSLTCPCAQRDPI